jgi:hypothetical protein
MLGKVALWTVNRFGSASLLLLHLEMPARLVYLSEFAFGSVVVVVTAEVEWWETREVGVVIIQVGQDWEEWFQVVAALLHGGRLYSRPDCVGCWSVPLARPCPFPSPPGRCHRVDGGSYNRVALKIFPRLPHHSLTISHKLPNNLSDCILMLKFSKPYDLCRKPLAIAAYHINSTAPELMWTVHCGLMWALFAWLK